MGRRGKRLLALLFLCNALQLLIGEASGSEDRFRAGGAAQIISDGVPGVPRGGPPQPLVQRRSFETSAKSSRSSTSDSWSFFNIGSSRNKRKLPSGRETISDFSCRDRPPGYYADMKLGCENPFLTTKEVIYVSFGAPRIKDFDTYGDKPVYHLCNRHGGGMAFECPRGTRFQQRTMVCDHEHLVECHQSAKYFHSNLRIGQANVNFIDDKQRLSSNSNRGADVFMQIVVRETTLPPPTSKPKLKKSLKSKLKEVREKAKMQLVFRQQQEKKQREQQQLKQQQQKKLQEVTHHDSFSRPEALRSKLTLKGRGKDTFFLLAQDTDAPGTVRDTRKVPKKILNQVKKSKPVKLVPKDKKILPSFPNYPVKMGSQDGVTVSDKGLSFHQAYGTDFDILRPKPPPSLGNSRSSTKSVTRTTRPPSFTRSTKPSTFILTPPDVNAPIADFFHKNKRKIPRKKKKPVKKKKKPIHRLPKNHPLRQVLPPTARVVGIQPLRKLALSNREENAEIMTLGDFLRKFPTMEKMKSTSIVPVPVTDAKHIRMIELLSAAQKTSSNPGSGVFKFKKSHLKTRPGDNSVDLDEMFKELEQLISKRAERKISFVNSQHHGQHHGHSKKKQIPHKNVEKSVVTNTKKPISNTGSSTKNPGGPGGLAVRPRGGLPGPRFMATTKSTTQTTETSSNLFQTGASSASSSTLNSWDNPRLEFGFVPITKTTSIPAVPAVTPTVTPAYSSVSGQTGNSNIVTGSSTFSFREPTGSRFRFNSFDGIIDETDQLVAPRLPRQPDNLINSIETNEINLDPSDNNGHDAFFFTTTPKPGVSAVSPSSSLLDKNKIKPGIFDMRKFFFIPTKNHHLSKSQAERRVHHHVHHGLSHPGFGHTPLLTPQHIPQPHRGFKFRG